MDREQLLLLLDDLEDCAKQLGDSGACGDMQVEFYELVVATIQELATRVCDA